MKTSRRAVVSGKVQGVFYRHSTVLKANELGLKGWIRNLENGDVECVICGENAEVEALCNWLRQGPPSAQVTGVVIEEILWEEHNAFSIVR